MQVEETENVEETINNDEQEKQLKMIDEMEHGGVIEDIDLTTDDWVNVNFAEITKRYDMIRRYVRFSSLFGIFSIYLVTFLLNKGNSENKKP